MQVWDTHHSRVQNWSLERVVCAEVALQVFGTANWLPRMMISCLMCTPGDEVASSLLCPQVMIKICKEAEASLDYYAMFKVRGQGEGAGWGTGSRGGQ